MTTTARPLIPSPRRPVHDTQGPQPGDVLALDWRSVPGVLGNELAPRPDLFFRVVKVLDQPTPDGYAWLHGYVLRVIVSVDGARRMLGEPIERRDFLVLLREVRRVQLVDGRWLAPESPRPGRRVGC